MQWKKISKGNFKIGLITTAILCSLISPKGSSQPKFDYSHRLTIINQANINLTFDVALAKSETEKERGLMFIKSLELRQGMLFEYNDTAIRSYWMKNTFIPLYIIFIDQNLKVDSIYFATPLDSEKLYTSQKPTQYVLELSASAFQGQKVEVGDRVVL